MNSSQIYDLIEIIAAEPKKTEKERLLKEHDCPELRRVLFAAYNPRLNYYVKKIPNSNIHQNQDFTELQWLMLESLSRREVTGNEALCELEATLDFLNVKSKELLSRIIKHDLRAGFSASTINKVFNKLIPEYPYMRCSLVSKVDTSKWDWESGVFSQTKMDGMFCNLTIVNGAVSMQSRQGSDFLIDDFHHIVKHSLEYLDDGYQYHGELLVVDADGKPLVREVGNGVLNSVLKGGSFPHGHSPQFVAWDMIGIDVVYSNARCNTPYQNRYKQLNDLPKSESFKVVPTKIIHSLEEAYKHYQEQLEQGQEGTIIKEPNMLWRDGTSNSCLKLKMQVDVDLEIVGFTKGNGKNEATFGSVETATKDRLLKVDVSGFTDEMRLFIHQNRDKLLGTIMTVRGNEIMRSLSASLFLPRFVELREDKTEADSYAEVVQQFENAKKCTR